MVPAAPLGDIVQQGGHIQHAPVLELRQHVRCQRVIVRQSAAFDVRQQANGPDRMLVHGIMMIHVELHLRHDPAEFRHEPAKHRRFVHPPQHLGGIARGTQYAEEQLVGARILAHLMIDAFGIAPCRAHRQRMHFVAEPVRQREHLDQTHRIILKEGVVRNGDTVLIQLKAIELFQQFRATREAVMQALGLRFFQMAEKQAGKIAHRLGIGEIEFHEPLDR